MNTRAAVIAGGLSSLLLAPLAAAQSPPGPPAEQPPVQSEPEDAAAIEPEPEPEPEPSYAAPRVTAKLRTQGPVVVGQMIELELALLRDETQPNRQPALFPELRVRGAISVRVQQSPPPGLVRVDGVAFVEQRRRYQIFALRPGALELPSAEILVPGAPGEFEHLATPPLVVEVEAVPHATASPPLVARGVELERTVAGELGSLRVGDAFRVDHVLRAADTDAVMLPSLELDAIEGLAAYPAEGSSSTRVDRGRVQATRTASVTYVARRAGRYDLPARSVVWLDPQTGELHEARVEALPVRVRLNPSLGLDAFGPRERLLPYLLLILLTLGAALGGVRLFRWLRARASARREVVRSASERESFEALLAAARSGGELTTLNALYRWLHAAWPRRPATLAALRRLAEDPALERATRELEARVTTSSQTGTSAALVEPLERLRSREGQTRADTRLSALNAAPHRADHR